jgi:hypothetical protein
MTFRIFALVAITLATLTGCATSFTSIEKQPDNSYYLTMMKRGPGFVAGSTWKCLAAPGDGAMKCSRVGVP